jgi:hypothetical protein
VEMGWKGGIDGLEGRYRTALPTVYRPEACLLKHPSKVWVCMGDCVSWKFLTQHPVSVVIYITTSS